MRIDILCYPGSDELDIIGPFRVLMGANKLGCNFKVNIVSLYPTDTIECTHGLILNTKINFVIGNQDMVIVVGGSWLQKGTKGAWAEYKNEYILKVLKEISKQGNIKLASVCTGAMLLAHAGLLTDVKATTHHSCYDELQKLGAIVNKDRVVEDKGFITAGGVTSGIDLGIYLTRKYFGTEIAMQLENELQYTNLNIKPT